MSKRTPTKQRLLTILKKANDLTITEIMKHFTISEIAVRKQLHELVQQGFVKQQSHKQSSVDHILRMILHKRVMKHFRISINQFQWSSLKI